MRPRDERPHPDQWILDALEESDRYDAKIDPHSDKYLKQNRYTGADFRQVRAAEVDQLPGKPTRIDFETLPDGTQIKRIWLAGWMPGYACHSAGLLAEGWTIDQALDHLEAEGWKVCRWPGAGRAFRVALRPVRTGEHLIRFRVRAKEHPPEGVDVNALDLMYYL